MTNRLLPADPLFSQQWFLFNTGQDIFGQPQPAGGTLNDINVTPVWPDYTGAGVRVAAIDDGFDETHPDLVANYRQDLAYDLDQNQPGAAPVESNDNHGTSVLGLIAAARNGIGGVGVAYGSEAVGYRGGAENFDAATKRMLADGISAVNNSYGSVEDDNPLGTASTQPALEADFKRLATEGRGGLGIVTVFAGGNDRAYGFLTSYDPTNMSPYTINIAASNADGTVTGYSTSGPNLLVAAPGSAPSSIVTTDRQGSAGYNNLKNGDYTDTVSSAFAGTSAAAPIATGVIALLLQANPNLGYRDVQEILAYSAHLPTGSQAAAPTATSDWNGGVHAYSTDLGFGNMDALAAVRMAETWNKQSTAANLLTETLSGSTGTVAAGEVGQFTTAAKFDAAIRIQHMTVDVDLDAPSLSGVAMTLLGTDRKFQPDGSTYSTTSLLMDKPATLKPITHLSYAFDVVNEWGTTAGIFPDSTDTLIGSYALVVTNSSAGTVTLNSFSVHLLGDAVTSDHTYVYTNDYAALAASDPSREKLADPGSGNHTINAAAVTGSSVIDLRPGGFGSLGGASFKTADGMTVKTVYTGDGDDQLHGNGMDNVLGAGRGTNTIDGGGGTDTAVLIGGRAGYQLGLGATGITANSNDGVTRDTLTSVEALRFTDAAADLTQALNGQIVAGRGASEFGHAYAGPVQALQWEFAAITPQSLVVAASTPDVFLRGGGGDDALAAMGGSNVLDGGAGSNWLVGATGADGGHDTFFMSRFLDSQAAAGWDTVLNFHAGDTLTVWGFDAARDSMSWQDGLGAAGYTGATLEMTDAGRAGVSLVTLAGLSIADSNVAATFGSVGGISYLALTKVA